MTVFRLSKNEERVLEETANKLGVNPRVLLQKALENEMDYMKGSNVNDLSLYYFDKDLQAGD